MPCIDARADERGEKPVHEGAGRTPAGARASAGRWGALVAASLPALAVACSHEHDARPEPPARAPLPPGLASFVPALEPPSFDGPHRSAPRYRVYESFVRYGKGKVVVRRYALHGDDDLGPGCPLAISPGGLCGTLAVNALPPRPLPVPWSIFASGDDEVFARSRCEEDAPGCVHKQSEQIDRIGEDGSVAAWLRDKNLGFSHQFWVIEAATRAYVLRDGEDNDLTLFEALPASPGQPRALSAPTALPIRHMAFSGDASARGTRAYAAPKKKVMFGEPAFVALPDRDGWAMAWLEVIPPARGVGREPPEPSKFGCGASRSRPISSPSIEKRVHVARFEGTRLLDDEVVQVPPFNPLYSGLRARLDGDKVRVEAGRWMHEASTEDMATGAPDEQTLGAAFDPSSRQGVVTFRVAERLFYRRFDEQGRLLGAAVPYRELSGGFSGDRELKDNTAPLLARAGGRWIAYLDDSSILPIEALSAPVDAEYPPGARVVGLVSGEPHARLISSKKNSIFATPIDGQGKAENGIEAAVVPETVSPASVRVVQIAGAPPVLIALAESEARTEKRYAWTWLEPGAPWSFPPEELAGFAPDPSRGTLLVAHDDVAVSLSNTTHQRLHWLRSGRVVDLPASRLESAFPASRAPVLRPSLPDGEASALLALPSPAGSLRAVPELLEAVAPCRFALPTGADTLVLVCMRAPSPAEAGVQVGLRSFRFAPPP